MLSAIIEILKKLFKSPPTLAIEDKSPKLDYSIFFSNVKKSLFRNKLNQNQVDGLNYLLKSMDKFSDAEKAYMLATAYHETAKTMQPIRERGGVSYFTRLYDIKGRNPSRARRYGNTKPGDGAKYSGRGYVQLTWKNNYKKMGELLGLDLVNNPELATDPKIAADIMSIGMEKGIFTGKSLSNYINNDKVDYVGARRIINGTDKATYIAGIANKFKDALDKAYVV